MEVFERVYLGDRYAAMDACFIKTRKIYHILNVTANIKNFFENKTEIWTPGTSSDDEAPSQTEPTRSTTDAYENFHFDEEDDKQEEEKKQDVQLEGDVGNLLVEPLGQLEQLEDNIPMPSTTTFQQPISEEDKENFQYNANKLSDQNFVNSSQLMNFFDFGKLDKKQDPTQNSNGLDQQINENTQKTQLIQPTNNNIQQTNQSKPKKKRLSRLPKIVYKLDKPVRYKKICINDSMEVNIKEYFLEGAKFIHESVLSGDACLVHCREARSRSVTMLVAYAICQLKWTLKQAYEHIEKVTRGHIRVNDGFKRQLMAFELEVHNFKENTINFFPKRKRFENYQMLEDGFDDDDEYIPEEDQQPKKKRKTKLKPATITKTCVKITFKASGETLTPVNLKPGELFSAMQKKKQVTLFDMFAKKKQPEYKEIRPKPIITAKKQTTLDSFFMRRVNAT